MLQGYGEHLQRGQRHSLEKKCQMYIIQICNIFCLFPEYDTLQILYLTPINSPESNLTSISKCNEIEIAYRTLSKIQYFAPISPPACIRTSIWTSMNLPNTLHTTILDDNEPNGQPLHLILDYNEVTGHTPNPILDSHEPIGDNLQLHEPMGHPLQSNIGLS